ncbi:hypothetical protein [Actinomyces naeslundii]|uniref:hypothetical protein n=1 Tax=Actinomyces naeslundii TaxID=1655 RepID=UPI00117868A8|nr:hypothetical protein [Actinomyces naeslundii]
MTTPPPIRAPKPTPLSGEEVVAGTDATVVDFWRFALSNLWMNNARGYLAEFLVAKAVGFDWTANRVGSLSCSSARWDHD